MTIEASRLDNMQNWNSWLDRNQIWTACCIRFMVVAGDSNFNPDLVLSCMRTWNFFLIFWNLKELTRKNNLRDKWQVVFNFEAKTETYSFFGKCSGAAWYIEGFKVKNELRYFIYLKMTFYKTNLNIAYILFSY